MPHYEDNDGQARSAGSRHFSSLVLALALLLGTTAMLLHLSGEVGPSPRRVDSEHVSRIRSLAVDVELADPKERHRTMAEDGAAAIHGRVVLDHDDGPACAGAAVELISLVDRGGESDEFVLEIARTDNGGKFELQTPWRDGLWLYCEHGGRRDTLVHALPGPNVITLAPESGRATVMGRAVANGRPVTEFSVHVFGRGLTEGVVTRVISASGEFRVNFQLVPDRAECSIAVVADGHRHNGARFEAAREETVDVGEIEMLEFLGGVEGVVCDAVSGDPIAGALVSPVGRSYGPDGTQRLGYELPVETDLDGRFAISSISSQDVHSLVATADGYADSFVVLPALPVSDGGGLVIAMERGNSLRGAVVPPLAVQDQGVRIRLTLAELGIGDTSYHRQWQRWGEIEADGQFRLDGLGHELFQLGLEWVAEDRLGATVTYLDEIAGRHLPGDERRYEVTPDSKLRINCILPDGTPTGALFDAKVYESDERIVAEGYVEAPRNVLVFRSLPAGPVEIRVFRGASAFDYASARASIGSSESTDAVIRL
ncbi:MAG: carboxypeptidase-like regulatory domain-containing protein [Acidobacteriota bacterium]